MKRFIATVLCLAVIFSLSACTAEETATASNPSSSSVPSYSSPSSSSSSSSELDSSVVGPTTSNGAEGPAEEVVSPSQPTEKPILPTNYLDYDRLNARQQEYYKNMLSGIENMQTGWIVLGESSETYQADIALVRSAVLDDHPEIFWIPSYYATAEAASSAGEKTAVIYFSVDAESPPSYLYTVREKEKMERELNKAADEIISKVTATDPYEVELQLHGLVCGLTEYNDDASDPSIYSAYGALVNKKALCEGYSRAMQLLLKKCGIPATVVSGVADGQDHMWNLVYIKDEWYNLDVTWNDMGEEISHEYFNLSDETISHDHSFHPAKEEVPLEELATGLVSFNINRPIANGTEHNYFYHSGFVLFSDGVSALAAYLAQTEGDFVEVRFSDRDFRDRVFEDSDEFIGRLNEALATDQAGCGFKIGGYAVSSMVLRLYKRKL